MQALHEIDKSIIDEIQAKVRRLSPPRHLTIRTVLIHQGALAPALVSERYFDRTISFEAMLNAQ